jgi:outer membrane protein assembly factor BamB
VIEIKNRRQSDIFILTYILASTVICVGILPMTQSPIMLPLDIDYIEEGPYSGNLLVAEGSGSICILSLDRETLWYSDFPQFFLHDVDLLPNGNLLVGEIQNDSVYELDIDTKEVVWEWNARNIDDVDWIELGNANDWSDDAMAWISNQNPTSGHWCHLNDVEFISGNVTGRNHDSILISLRNFDMIIEVNYTSSKELIWHYGEPYNHELLNHQHNPDILENKHILLSDSENERILEIDYDTRQVVWEYRADSPLELRWARDVDDLGDGTYLITDTNNNRLLRVERATGDEIMIYDGPWYFLPYDSEVITVNGQKLIFTSDAVATGITVIDFETGMFATSYGLPFMLYLVYLLLGFFALISLYDLVKILRKNDNEKGLNRLKSFEALRKITHIILTIIFLSFIPSLIGYFFNFGIRKLLEGLFAFSYRIGYYNNHNYSHLENDELESSNYPLTIRK